MDSIQVFGEINLHPEVLSKLPQHDQKIAKLTAISAHNPKIGEMNGGQIVSLLESILLKATIKLGLNVKKGDESYKHLMTCINEDLVKKFPNMTKEEVYNALDAGLDGEFQDESDPKIFFNPSNLVRWIKAWIEKVKKPVMKKVLELQHNIKQPMAQVTEPEMMHRSFNLYLDSCVNSKDNGVIFEDYGGLIYNFLVKLGVVDEVSPELLTECAEQLRYEAYLNRDRSEAKSMENLLAKIESGETDDATRILGYASRKIVANELRLIATWDDDAILRYLQNIKEMMLDYISDMPC